MQAVDATILSFSGKTDSCYLQSPRGWCGRQRFLNDKHWIYGHQAFYMWFANHFIANLPPARPVVLLIDGHDSHLDLHTFQLTENNHVYRFSLLKNATHLVQPVCEF